VVKTEAELREAAAELRRLAETPGAYPPGVWPGVVTLLAALDWAAGEGGGEFEARLRAMRAFRSRWGRRRK
jgi:hypothetical protein